MLVRPDPNEDNPLWKYFVYNEGRIIHKWHHYFDIYHNHFSRFRDLPITILEIGVYKGGSLQMWKNYFGDKAKIYGVDIDPQCKELEEDQIKIFIGDQANRDFLRELRDEIGTIDILIDDGGHTMAQQITTFEELYPAVSEIGVYLVEDLHTSYWEDYGGGYKKQGSFIEYAKDFIDSMNAWHSRDPELTPGNLTKSATGIHFYDSVLVIEKYPNTVKPKVRITGRDESVNPFNKLQSVPSPVVTPSNAQTDRLAYLDLMKRTLLDLIYSEPDDMVMSMLSKQLVPVEEARQIGVDWPERALTMIGLERLNNLQFCVEDVLQRGIPGDFIETGVWRGGSCIFMRAILKVYGVTDRIVWVADSFQGLPSPDSEHYPLDKGLDLSGLPELAVSRPEVAHNFERFDLLDDQVQFLEGWFKDTLAAAPIKQLAVLRLDGDLYQSTMEALVALYPKLTPGGYIIIDDYGAVEACRRAVHDYRDQHSITEEIHIIDWGGVYWQRIG